MYRGVYNAYSITIPVLIGVSREFWAHVPIAKTLLPISP